MNVLEKILEEIDRLNEPYFVGHIDKYKVKEIIRSHMDEMNNDDWIPVEERLPEVPENLEDACCPEFNVTIKGEEEATTLKYSCDGSWFDDYGTVYNVIAWQPLPERYKGDRNA